MSLKYSKDICDISVSVPAEGGSKSSKGASRVRVRKAPLEGSVMPLLSGRDHLEGGSKHSEFGSALSIRRAAVDLHREAVVRRAAWRGH